jgi:hypothetical protein
LTPVVPNSAAALLDDPPSRADTPQTGIPLQGAVPRDSAPSRTDGSTSLDSSPHTDGSLNGFSPQQNGLASESEGSSRNLLTLAKTEYDAGRIASSLDALGKYRAANPFGSDELYWLYGQALEANGPTKDIKTALDYYRRLVDEYPQSARYGDARRRIAYLERFYFNIQ